METILNNSAFSDAFERLQHVSLNPRRHAAANAKLHSEWVAARARILATANGCSPEETGLLINLGLAHDIGKTAGTTKPAKSVEMLLGFGVQDEGFMALVKVHDTNLPWFLSAQKGQAPSEKAWSRLARNVDLRLLVLFMVADRVDCPGGWQANTPLCWFIEQARARKLIPEHLDFDVPGDVFERSAGCVLVDEVGPLPRALLIRTRTSHFELPKGHVEWDEALKDAAARELAEETGLATLIEVGECIDIATYSFERGESTVHKTVHIYRATTVVPLEFRPKPRSTRELKWVGLTELADVSFTSEALRDVVEAALRLARD